MLYFQSKKKLKAERVRLQAEVDIIVQKNIHRMLAASKAGKPLTHDEIMEPLKSNPLFRRLSEIENQLVKRTSKRELVAERNALQSRLDLSLQTSLSEEDKLGVRQVNGKISKLDYEIKSKSRFGSSTDDWFDNVRAFFILAVGAVAIGSIVFRLFS